MSADENRTCYLCDTVAATRTMTRLTSGDVELWWCDQPAYCRTRAAVNKLHAGGILRYVKVAYIHGVDRPAAPGWPVPPTIP